MRLRLWQFLFPQSWKLQACRAALRDAIDKCHCGGGGFKLTAGGGRLICGTCFYWRNTLQRTK